MNFLIDTTFREVYNILKDDIKSRIRRMTMDNIYEWLYDHYFKPYEGEILRSYRDLADAVSAHLLYEELAGRFFSCPEAFAQTPLICRIRREQPASKKQKEVLQDLVKYHKISLTVQVDSLSRNEASRLTDRIISQYGRMIKR